MSEATQNSAPRALKLRVFNYRPTSRPPVIGFATVAELHTGFVISVEVRAGPSGVRAAPINRVAFDSRRNDIVRNPDGRPRWHSTLAFTDDATAQEFSAAVLAAVRAAGHLTEASARSGRFEQ